MGRAARRRNPIAFAALNGLFLCSAAAAQPRLPFGPGERVTMRFSYLHLTAGRATMRVESDVNGGQAVFRFVSVANSEGFFAWLTRFRVKDRTDAWWQPDSGCSLGIEKHLREGRAVRDQVVTILPAAGIADVRDPKIAQTRFDIGPCTLDVLSAFFVIRQRGVSEQQPLLLPVFDNGKRYVLRVRFLARELLDLPPPFGKKTRTIVVEPELAEGTGLFVKKGRLKVWLTDDARRVPVRMRTRVAIGAVSGDLEAYEPPADDNVAPAGTVRVNDCETVAAGI
jgi:hypothetical protein